MKIKKGSIVKEIIICILLLILIMLLLVVALYDFIPSDLTIPDQVEYASDSTTTSIRQEIKYTNDGDKSADESFIDGYGSLKSYSVESQDLTVYGQKDLYNSGNSNPFDYAEEGSATTGAGSTGTNTGGTSTNGTTNKATNSANEAGGSNTASNGGTTAGSATGGNNATAGSSAGSSSPKTGTTSGTFFEKPSSK